MSDHDAVLSRPAAIASWILQVLVAVPLGVFGAMKLPYPEATQAVFAELGGRPAATATGLAEMTAAILLLVPRLVPVGAALAAGVMTGAVGSHLLVLGISVDVGDGPDGGAMFGMAVGLLVLALAVLVLRRRQARTLLPGSGAPPA